MILTVCTKSTLREWRARGTEVPFVRRVNICLARYFAVTYNPTYQRAEVHSMAQYQQKTDSREFEVANPDPSPGPWSRDGANDAADIVVRLWGPRPGPSLSWKTDSVLVYMITDLVAASHGRIAEESPAVLGAHFDGSRPALVAAKRIQMSILEFLACRPGDRVGAAILIYRPRASVPTGYSAEAVQPLLRQAKPGQILLAASISERLRDLPGVAFRSVPALTTVAGDRQTELSELVWTTPEQLAFLQNSVGEEPERTEDPPAVGATVMVDSPFVLRGTANETPPATSERADFVSRDEPQADSRRFETLPATDHELQASTAGSILDGLEDFEKPPLITRTRVIFGVVALVLAGALISVLYRPARVSKPPLPALQEQTGATESPDKVTPSVTTQPEAKTPTQQAPQPEDKTPVTPPQPVTPAAKLPEVVAKPQHPAKPSADARAKKSNAQDDAQEPAVGATDEAGGLSQNDIPKLLEFANADTGNGQYGKARLEYRKVLKLQPNNQAAKDGLRKLDRIQSDQQ